MFIMIPSSGSSNMTFHVSSCIPSSSSSKWKTAAKGPTFSQNPPPSGVGFGWRCWHWKVDLHWWKLKESTAKLGSTKSCHVQACNKWWFLHIVTAKASENLADFQGRPAIFEGGYDPQYAEIQWRKRFLMTGRFINFWLVNLWDNLSDLRFSVTSGEFVLERFL